MTLDDQRGQHEPPNKISSEALDLVKNHILSIPTYESHYCRKKTGDKRFLPSFYTLCRLYEEYKTWVAPNQQVSRKIYESVFHKMNIGIKKYSKDTCQNCDRLNSLISNEKNLEKRESLKEELKTHQEEAENAYEAKRTRNLRLKTVIHIRSTIPTDT